MKHALLLAALVPLAMAQTLQEYSSETRFQLDLKVPDAALASYLPKGWTPNVAAQGAAKDCNLRAVFIDRITINGPDGKPLGKGSNRLVYLVAPVKDPSGANVQLVIGGLTEDPADAPGPFGNYLLATTHNAKRATMYLGAVALSTQDWEFAAASGERLELHISFVPGVGNKGNPAEVKFYSAKNPGFFQISKQEQVLDILRNVTTNPPDRVKSFSFKGSGGSFAKLFDVAQRADPEEKFTPDSLREQQKPTEASVLDSLQRLGHQVETLAVFDNVTTIVEKLKACAPDVVFNLTESFHHDRSHEPNIPALLELMKVRYTGAGPEGLLLCKDKALAKKVLAYHRVRLPRFVVSHQARPVRGLQRFKYPAFVKPVGEESSDGIAKASFVRTADEAMERVRYIHQKFECDVLIEEYIEGRELYLSVLGNRRLTVFPPREIFFEQVPDDVPKFATSHAKWNEKYREKWGIKNGPAAELPAGLEDHLKQLARKVYRVLKIEGFGRVDVRLTPQGDVFVIEANPNPSLAQDEDFAQAALSAGVDYDALITEILNAAQI
jgi:D-alanine-D-alanine ligase